MTTANYKPEPPCPEDRIHQTMRGIGLTVSDCDGRACSQMRDIAIVARSKFGEESDEALEAMHRMALRTRQR